MTIFKKGVIRIALVLIATGLPIEVKADLVRIFLVDVSSSMSATGRIETVKRELALMNQQLPASKQFPIIIIPFSDSPKSPQVFVDGRKADEAIKNLTLDGGTDIASVLRVGREAIKKYAANSPATLVFISDGEDPNIEGIQRETDKLNTLFESRGATGLSSSVFMKRWGGANQNLAESLASNKSVSLIDATTNQIVPVTIEARATISEVAWVEPGKVAEGWIEFRATSAVDSPVSVSVGYNVNGVVLGGKCTVQLGGNHRQKIRFNVSDAQARKGEVSLLALVNAKKPDTAANGSVVMPVIKQPNIKLIARLPDVANADVSIDTLIDGNSSWIDPISGLAKFSVRVTITTNRDSNLAGHKIAKEMFEIVPTGHCTVSKPVIVSLDRVNKKTASFHVQGCPVDAKQPFKSWRYRMQFIVRPKDAPSYVRYTPEEIKVDQTDILPPHPIDVTVGADLVGAKPVRWTRVDDPTAEFVCRVNLEPSKPLPSAFRLTGFCGDNGTVRIRKTTRSARATKMDFILRLRHADGTIDLAPNFATPYPSGYRVTSQPIHISPDEWPNPMSLGIEGKGFEIQKTRSFFHDLPFGSPFKVGITPCLWTKNNVDGVENLSLEFDTDDSRLAIETKGNCRTYLPILITPSIPDESRPFFTRSVETCEFTLKPDSPNVAIEPSNIKLRIVHMPPIYKTLFLVVAAIFVLVISIGTLWFAVRRDPNRLDVGELNDCAVGNS